MAKVTLSGIRAVVFDLDDTLYPERSFAFSGFEAVADWLQGRVDCPFDAAARMRELFETGDRRRVFDQLLAELGCDQAETLVPAMVDCYRSHPPAIRLYEDAEGILADWRGRFRLGLISDGPQEMQQRKVGALGLAGVLGHIVLTDQWGREFWKPHHRAYRELEAAFDVNGADCVYIADNPEKDFVAPRQLDWRTVRIIRSDGVYRDAIPPVGGEAEFQVTSLARIDITAS